jgi:hypothetical protein
MTLFLGSRRVQGTKICSAVQAGHHHESKRDMGPVRDILALGAIPSSSRADYIRNYYFTPRQFLATRLHPLSLAQSFTVCPF